MLVRLVSSLTLVFSICAVGLPKAIADEIGPVGGTGGKAFRYVSPKKYFTQVFVHAGKRIDSIRFIAEEFSSERYGGGGGTQNVINIDKRQCIVAIEGTTATAGRGRERNTRIASLEFVFANGRRSNRFGTDGKDRFRLAAPKGQEIIGFWGQYGDELDAIGIITGPSWCR